MNIEGNVNAKISGAGNINSGAMIIRVVKYPLIYFGLLLTSALLLSLFLALAAIIMLFTLGGARFTDPGSVFMEQVLTPVLLVTGIIFLALALIQRKKMFVTPLGYRGYRDLVLVNEGVYAKIRTNATRGIYRFYPWSSLKIYHVDDNKKVLGLKSNFSLIKISDPRDFDGLKNIIFSRIPSKVPMINKKIPFVQVKFLAVAFIIFLVLLLAAGTYYSNIYNNPPNDHRCDVSGERATKILTITYSNGTMINNHEYCDWHLTTHFFLKPWEILSTDIQNTGENEKLILLAIMLFPWFILTLVLLYLSIPRWHKSMPYI